MSPLPTDTPIKEVIQAAFDTSLPVSGGWGYRQDDATILEANSDNTPLTQLEHMLASMRAYLEMNLTVKESERYGSINLNEKSRKQHQDNGKVWDEVVYTLTAMKESDYAMFIEEYKEGYGKETFDMQAHFARRKEATLTQELTYWFDVTHIS